jgi:hypothetical protein
MEKSPKQILVEELKITRQAIEQHRDKIKKKYGPMSDAEAYGVIGHLAGKDVSKLLGLDSETLGRVRDICFRIQNPEKESSLKKSNIPNKKGGKNIHRVIRIGDHDNYKDPLLPERIIDDAKNMRNIYATLYIFENSVREVISRVMAKKYEGDWWNKLNAPKAQKMRRDVKGRMATETKNAWHGKRGNHPIYYTDISDLINIIEEYWSDFSSLFPGFKWVETRIGEISISRNVVDHHNPLKDNDQQRVLVYFNDWCDQVESIKSRLDEKEEK